MRVCSYEDCGKPYYCKGYCTGHYRQSQKGGEVRPLRAYGKNRVCSFDGCNEPHHGKGLCEGHHHQLRSSVQLRPLGPRTDVGYQSAHRRIWRTLGPARDHTCMSCDKVAAQWAYIGGCPDERTQVRGKSAIAYSLDPDRYVPMCSSCHRRHDLDMRKGIPSPYAPALAAA